MIKYFLNGGSIILKIYLSNFSRNFLGKFPLSNFLEKYQPWMDHKVVKLPKWFIFIVNHTGYGGDICIVSLGWCTKNFSYPENVSSSNTSDLNNLNTTRNKGRDHTLFLSNAWNPFRIKHVCCAEHDEIISYWCVIVNICNAMFQPLFAVV